MAVTQLKGYSTGAYKVGASKIKQVLWYFTNLAIFRSYIFPFSGFKVFLLRLFGAKIGHGVVIKPNVNIKYPWHLEIDDHTWVGEEVWIDNLVLVTIGSNVCISQGAMLLTGNHNYKNTSFDLITGQIKLEDGVWLGAKSLVCPGVTMESHSLLTVSSVMNKDAEAYSIYQGNPAIKVRERTIS